MNAIKKIGFRTIAVALFCISTVALYAPPPVPGGTPPPGCWPPPCVPLDGGIGLLIAAGLAFGAKKSFDNITNKKS